jgi:hypothetical protein
MRYIPSSKRFFAEDGTVLGPSPAGFVLRDDDRGGLSVTEIEHFGDMSAAARREAAVAHRESLPSKKVGAAGIYAWAQIDAAKTAALAYNKKIRVVHDPVDGNPGHAEIRHFTDEDLDLLDHFATDVFVDYEVIADMALPPRA